LKSFIHLLPWAAMGRALVKIEHQPFLDESLRNAKTNISKKSPYLNNEFLEVMEKKQDPRKFSVFKPKLTYFLWLLIQMTKF